MKSNEEVIGKIQRLLSLANSDNEHEAQLAAKMAAKLLTKHNLSLQDVEVSDRDYGSVDYTSDSVRIKPEQKFVFSIVSKFFFIQVLHRRVYSSWKNKHMFAWSFFGENHNIKIAQFVYAFLTKSFVELYKNYKAAGGETGVSARNSFYMGVYRGLRQQLEESQAEAESETGLVIIKDPGIKEYMNEQVGKTVNVPQKYKANVDSDAYNKGMQEGRNLRIAMGIESNRSQDTTKTLAGRK